MDENQTERSKKGFNRFLSLEGKWRDINSTTTVEFRMSAYGSVVVETWIWPEKNIESLTIYFLDNRQLAATHYCPIGNQPSFKFVTSENENRVDFEFTSATNLVNKSEDHCESFWFEFISSDEFIRSESYWESGTLVTTQSTYHKVV